VIIRGGSGNTRHMMDQKGTIIPAWCGRFGGVDRSIFTRAVFGESMHKIMSLNMRFSPWMEGE
jgi:hypothetical protein